MSCTKTGICYAVFCAIATSINVLTQRITIVIAGNRLFLAMATGAIAGVGIKYILDKKFIFRFVPRARTEDLRTFALYVFMSGITTAVFLATEVLFDRLFHSSYAKYIGALAGLTLGYTLKYFLDKRFVFSRQNDAASGHSP